VNLLNEVLVDNQNEIPANWVGFDGKSDSLFKDKYGNRQQKRKNIS